jgi:hypothetical protein
MSDEESTKKVELHLTTPTAAGLSKLFERLTGNSLSPEGQERIRKALERASKASPEK